MNYDKLPKHMQQGFKDYINHGLCPGGFATACLENRLVEAFQRADDINKYRLDDIADWLWWECPEAAWGSPDKVTAWIDSNGLRIQETPNE